MTTTTEHAFGLKPGDIFVCSWGYDQTNVDFYEVVATTRKAVKLRRIAARHEADEAGSSIRKYALPSTYLDDEVLTKFPVMLDDDRDRIGVRMTSYSFAWLESPERLEAGFYETAAGWGH